MKAGDRTRTFEELVDTGPIPDAALGQHVFLGGKTGSGKSYATQGIVERLIARKRRVCLIDPTDRYWGLRLSADGRSPSGLQPVIFGGQYADLPLSGAHGAAIAEIVGTTTTPVIIATRQLSVSARSRFFTDFAEKLLQVNQGDLHLVIDEAHLFMPQSGAAVGGGVPAMLHAGNNLVSLGRGVGLMIMMLSQRPAKLHKDSYTQAETLVAFRLIGPQDRNAVRDWVREWADDATGADLMSSLPSLPTGEAWVWSPELGVLRRGMFPSIATFDSGNPKVVAALVARRKGKPALTPIDLATVGAKLEAVAKEAIENDPRRLKARVADLERQLAKPAPAAADQQQLDQANRDGYDRGREDGYALGWRAGSSAALEYASGTVSGGLARMAEGWASIPMMPMQVAKDWWPAPASEHERRGLAAFKAGLGDKETTGYQPREKPGPAPQPPSGGSSAQRPNGSAEPTSRITLAHRRILDALATLRAARIDPAKRTQVAFLAGYSPNSSSFANNLGALRTSGLISYPSGGEIALTDAGSAEAVAGELLSSADLHSLLREKLGAPRWSLVERLIQAYPDAITREQLAQDTRYSPNSSSYANNLGALRSLGLIEYPSPGYVAAQPVLFLQ